MSREARRGGQRSSEQQNGRQDAPKRPVFDSRAGMVKVAIWENEGKNGVFPTASFSRLYKDKNEKWQSAASFNVWDLVDLARCAFTAEAYIRTKYGDEEEPGDEGRRDERAA